MDQMNHVWMIGQNRCQRDENESEFNQCLVVRRDQPEEQPPIGKPPPGARNEAADENACPEESSEPSRVGGVVKPDPHRTRQDSDFIEVKDVCAGKFCWWTTSDSSVTR